MAGQLNKVLIIGNVCSPPIQDITKQDKTPFAMVQIANHIDTGGSDKPPHVNFLQCIAWGKLVDVIMAKVYTGDEILIEGRVNYTSWEKDGERRQKVQITIEHFTILKSKKSENK